MWVGTLERLDATPPFTAAQMADLGLRGLNCGSGKAIEAGWMNVDFRSLADERRNASDPGVLMRVDGERYFLQHDLREPLPFEDESFDWAYSEHMVEHMTLQEATAWLREVRRVLRRGGLVRISTPSLARYVEGYVDPERRFYTEHRERLATLPIFRRRGVPDRPGWMLNQVFYSWGHKWIYDLGEIRHVAAEAGFDTASLIERAYGESAVPEAAALDRPGRSDVSLYAELSKQSS